MGIPALPWPQAMPISTFPKIRTSVLLCRWWHTTKSKLIYLTNTNGKEEITCDALEAVLSDDMSHFLLKRGFASVHTLSGSGRDNGRK